MSILGFHLPGDVLAGFMLGLCVGCLLALLALEMQRARY